jgi:hypothetical protein
MRMTAAIDRSVLLRAVEAAKEAVEKNPRAETYRALLEAQRELQRYDWRIAAVLLGILFAATSDSVVPPGGMAVTGIGGAVAVVRLFQIYRTLKIIRRIWAGASIVSDTCRPDPTCLPRPLNRSALAHSREPQRASAIMLATVRMAEGASSVNLIELKPAEPHHAVGRGHAHLA